MNTESEKKMLEDLYTHPEKCLGAPGGCSGYTLPWRNDLERIAVSPDSTKESLKYYESTYGLILKPGPQSGTNYIYISSGTKRIDGGYQVDFHGRNNTLVIGQAADRQAVLSGRAEFNGNGSSVIISDGLRRDSWLEFRLFHDNQYLFWGKGATADSLFVTATGDNRKIIIGDDCMFSKDVRIRNGDGHTLFDLGTGKPYSRHGNVLIEPHVWAGEDVLVLGSVMIGYGSVIGAKSLVKTDVPACSLYAGVPALQKKTGVSWDRSMDQTVNKSTVTYLEELEKDRGTNMNRTTTTTAGMTPEDMLQDSLRDASMRVKKGELSAAISLYTDILKENPHIDELYSVLCDLYLLEKKADVPSEWITRAVKRDKGFAASFSEFAATLFNEQKYEDALHVLSSLVQVTPDNCEVWNDLGVVQLALEGHVVAEQSFKQALILNRYCGDAIRNLVFVYLSSGRMRDAVQLARVLLEKDCSAAEETCHAVGNLIADINPEEAETFLQESAKKYGYRDHSISLAKTSGESAAADMHDSGDTAPENFSPDLENKAVVWYSTMKCNNRCPYCLAFQVSDPMIKVPFRPYQEWVDVWNSIDGNLTLDITGGEPFLLPDFVTMINSFKDTIRIAMTTNTKCDMTQFVQQIPPERVISITTSLHPSQSMNVENFLGKIMMLQKRGFPVSVNYVAYPEQLWLIPYFKEIIEGAGIRFHVDPYGPGPKKPFILSETEEEFLKQYVGMDRNDFFNSAPVQYTCSGGMDFFSVLPNGDTYTCVTKRYVDTNYVGNVFEPDFRLRDSAIQCQAVSCAGCDLDKVTRVPLKAKHEVQH